MLFENTGAKTHCCIPCYTDWLSHDLPATQNRSVFRLEQSLEARFSRCPQQPCIVSGRIPSPAAHQKVRCSAAVSMGRRLWLSCVTRSRSCLRGGMAFVGVRLPWMGASGMHFMTSRIVMPVCESDFVSRQFAHVESTACSVVRQSHRCEWSWVTCQRCRLPPHACL